MVNKPNLTLVIALLCLLGFGVTSLFGVVLEGPYGSVPLGSSVGIAVGAIALAKSRAGTS